MKNRKNQILNHQQIKQKIKRIAYQVYENNFEEKQIIFAGIAPRGTQLSQLIYSEFTKICTIQAQQITIRLDKKNPAQSDILMSTNGENIANQTIILVDDVLHTGRTFAYALKPFLEFRVKKLQTIVLVDRGHTSFPISADFAGYALSTTVLQHIDVRLDDPENFGVYLF